MFEALYARGEVAEQVTDVAWLRAMCDVESALARAQAALGEIPPAAADAIVAACAQGVDAAAVDASLADSATPVIGLVDQLRVRVGSEQAPHVHAGATSQDIVDTALMLIAKRALDPLLADIAAAADAAAALAQAHRATPMIARTLLQQALPTTFGLLAAGWLDGLTQNRVHLHHVRDAELTVQMGGAVGGRAPQLADRVAAELGLAAPAIGWATVRVHTAITASILGTTAGALGKIARDVTLLAQTEVGELAEGRAGGSSAMSHKRNPVAAVAALACVRRTPGLVATMVSAMQSELQRAAGAWQAEWGTLTELLALTGSAAAWTCQMLAQLQVDAPRMAANLAAAPTADHSLPDGVDALIDRALAAHASMGP